MCYVLDWTAGFLFTQFHHFFLSKTVLSSVTSGIPESSLIWSYQLLRCLPHSLMPGLLSLYDLFTNIRHPFLNTWPIQFKLLVLFRCAYTGFLKFYFTVCFKRASCFTSVIRINDFLSKFLVKLFKINNFLLNPTKQGEQFLNNGANSNEYEVFCNRRSGCIDKGKRKQI